MLRFLTIATVAVFGATTLSPSASAGFYSNDGGEPYALAYCNFYKTRAMWAGQKARANPRIGKHRRRAISMWRKYNYCLKDNGWPVTFAIPAYR